MTYRNNAPYLAKFYTSQKSYQSYKSRVDKRTNKNVNMEGINQLSKVFQEQLSFLVFKKEATFEVDLKFVHNLFNKPIDIKV